MRSCGLIINDSTTPKMYEVVKKCVNEQVVLRSEKKTNGPVPMDHLADKIIASAQGARSGGPLSGWPWLEEGHTRAAWQSKSSGEKTTYVVGSKQLAHQQRPQ